MKFIKIGVILTFSALFIFACSGGGTNNSTTNNAANSANNSTNKSAVNSNLLPATPMDELAAVRKIYDDDCAKCHKENGMGGPTEVDGKTIKVPDFYVG